MRIRTALAVATLVPTAFAFAPVTTAAEGDCRVDEERTVTVDGDEVPVEYCESTAFAQCDAKAQGGKLVLPNEGVTLAADAPAGSFTAGEGCGTVDEPVFGNTALAAGLYHYYLDGLLFEAGNVDSLTFEAHFLGPNLGYTGQEVVLDMRMTVNGVSVFGTETGTDVTGEPFSAPKQREVKVTPVVSSTGASSSIRFTVTGLSDYMPDEFANEAGGGDDFAQIAIGMNFPRLEEPCVATPTNGTERCMPFGPSPLVMGAVEVPTGATLNAAPDAWGVETPAGDLEG